VQLGFRLGRFNQQCILSVFQSIYLERVYVIHILSLIDIVRKTDDDKKTGAFVAKFQRALSLSNERMNEKIK
jgi:hypothetical protein